MSVDKPGRVEKSVGVGMLAVAAYGILHIISASDGGHPWYEWALLGFFAAGGFWAIMPFRSEKLWAWVLDMIQILRKGHHG